MSTSPISPTMVHVTLDTNHRERGSSVVEFKEYQKSIGEGNVHMLSTKMCSLPADLGSALPNEDNSEEILCPEPCTSPVDQPAEAWRSQEIKDRMLWAKGFKYCKAGGLIFIDKEIQKKQQGVVKDVLLHFGSQVVAGKVDPTFSLPVRVFEPRSMLQRVTDAWKYAPTLLSRAAAETSSPVERLKHVASFVAGGLHFCLGQLKPFNPILGETYQAYMPDDTHIYMEHISHHPPICSFLVYGPSKSYILSGIYEFTASMKGNAFCSAQVGNANIDFPDGTRITYTVPYVKMSGLLVGDRQVEWLGEAKFVDQKNKLECVLTLNPPSSLFAKAVKSDEIKGFIRSTDKNNSAPISSAEGSWLAHLAFDGKKYWDLKTEPVFPVISSPDALPSDSIFRSDLVALANGQEEAAQENKLNLEARQRADRKLRLAKKKVQIKK